MTSDPNELIRRIKDHLAAASDIRLAYVFGSLSRGTLGPLSDVDVAVVFDNSVPSSDFLRRRLDLVAGFNLWSAARWTWSS